MIDLDFASRTGGRALRVLDGSHASIPPRPEVGEPSLADMRLARALDAGATVGMAIVDVGGRFTTVNPALSEILGFTAAQLSEKTFGELAVGPERSIAGGRVEQRLRRADGSLVCVALTISPLARQGGEPVAHLAYVEEVGRRAPFDERADALDCRDALTGLGNRRSLDAELPQRIVAARHAGADLHVVMIDLDRFTSINERFGDAAGDNVLVAAGTVLATNVRAGDGTFRYDGDAFAVVLERAPRETIVALLTRVRNALGALELAYAGTGHPMRASFGVASLRRDADDAQALLELAGRALLRSKGEGGDGVSLA